MIKNTQNTFLFVQDNEAFLNNVFRLSQVTNFVIVKNSKKFVGADNAIVFRNSMNVKFCRYHAIVNDYDVYDFYGYLCDGLRRHEKLKLGMPNAAYSESLRQGMLAYLPEEQAQQYYEGLKQHEQQKLDNYLANIGKILEQK